MGSSNGVEARVEIDLRETQIISSLEEGQRKELRVKTHNFRGIRHKKNGRNRKKKKRELGFWNS